MKYAFLDTNALMHFKVFEGIKWNDFLSSEDYTLVISLTVIDELDKHKDSNKTKNRNRAKVVLKILNDYLDDENYKKNNINLIFCDNAKTFSNSSEYSGGREDDYIIASAKAFNGDGEKIIVSYDTGMRFRAKKAGLKFLPLEEDQMLSQEPTEEEKEIKTLKKELAKYTDRKATPVLLFNNGEDKIIRKAFKESDVKEYLKKEEEQLRKDLKPYIKLAENSYDIFHLKMSALVEGEFDNKDIEEYNSSIEPYIADFLKLKSISLKRTNLDRFVYEIKLSVFNRGNKPTGKMGLQIILPEELIFVDKNAYIEYDVTPPEKPKLLSPLQKAISQNYLYKPFIPGYGPMNEGNRKYEGHWNLKESLNKEIFFELPKLIHNLNINIDFNNGLYFFASKPGEYSIKWCIVEESTPDPIIGELGINVE